MIGRGPQQQHWIIAHAAVHSQHVAVTKQMMRYRLCYMPALQNETPVRMQLLETEFGKQHVMQRAVTRIHQGKKQTILEHGQDVRILNHGTLRGHIIAAKSKKAAVRVKFDETNKNDASSKETTRRE